jgi:hypothetical protein
VSTYKEAGLTELRRGEGGAAVSRDRGALYANYMNADQRSSRKEQQAMEMESNDGCRRSCKHRKGMRKEIEFGRPSLGERLTSHTYVISTSHSKQRIIVVRGVR